MLLFKAYLFVFISFLNYGNTSVCLRILSHNSAATSVSTMFIGILDYNVTVVTCMTSPYEWSSMSLEDIIEALGLLCLVVCACGVDVNTYHVGSNKTQTSSVVLKVKKHWSYTSTIRLNFVVRYYDKGKR